MPRIQTKWTAEKRQQLRDLYPKHSRAEIGEIMGLGNGQIRSQLMLMGLNTKAPGRWTPQEIDLLISAYNGKNYSEDIGLPLLAKRLSKHKTNVCRKARELGLTNNKREDKRTKKLKIRKFATDEELRTHIGECAKRRWLEKGHPKGMKGKKHTLEVCATIGKKSKQRWLNFSEEERATLTFKASKTRMERHGAPIRPHTTWKAGYRDIGGKRHYFRSKWEMNYARYLEYLKQRDAIVEWEYEPHTFWFEKIKRGVRCYTPDFRITALDGSQYFDEVKGWMDKRSATKLKRMKKYHPATTINLVQGDWFKSANKRYSGLIDGWE